MSPELAALCDDFQSALARGERPSIRDWAESGSAIPELAALELHYRLGAGDGATAGEYFERFPEIALDRPAAVRLVAVEYRAAAKRDATIGEPHFRGRYPDLAKAPEWSDGPWAGDTAPVGGTGTEIQQLPPPSTPPSAPTATADLPDHLAAILQPAFAEHPTDVGRLGEYRIFGVLGRGGMGAVLAGANVHSGHPAAVKVMLPEQARQGCERFLREARAAQKIDHPRVVPIYHVGEANGVPYIAMKRLDGRSLTARLGDGPPTLTEVARIGREVAEGLAAAHALKIVHRDLKPDNIWLESGPDGEHVRLLDFGLARPVGETAVEGVDALTTRNTIAGTPAYMSPEQADAREVDGRSDLWSLGVVLYRLVAKRYPFGKEPLTKVLNAIANETPTPLHEIDPAVPMRLSNLVAKLLEKNPNRRPADANAVIRELAGVESGEPAPSNATRTYVASEEKRRRRGRWWPFAILAATAIVAAGYFSLTSSRDRANRETPSPNGATPPPAAVAPLVVKSISLSHLANLTPGKEIPDVVSRGILGKDSFSVTLEDRMKAEVELSRPAYCYLVVFRPDGVVECIDPEPEDADKPPRLTDRPRYPPKTRDDFYGLTDGTGLCVVGVVASPSPLPAFTMAVAGKPLPKVGGGKSPAGTVWWDDGTWVESLTRIGADRGTRGAGAKVQGVGDVTAAVDWLRKLAGDKDAVGAAIGFVVEPRN